MLPRCETPVQAALDFNRQQETLHAIPAYLPAVKLSAQGRLRVSFAKGAREHSTLEMTRRYANLVTADLSAVHQRISLLAA